MGDESLAYLRSPDGPGETQGNLGVESKERLRRRMDPPLLLSSGGGGQPPPQVSEGLTAAAQLPPTSGSRAGGPP